jgi:hypothetical protein
MQKQLQRHGGPLRESGVDYPGTTHLGLDGFDLRIEPKLGFPSGPIA